MIHFDPWAWFLLITVWVGAAVWLFDDEVRRSRRRKLATEEWNQKVDAVFDARKKESLAMDIAILEKMTASPIEYVIRQAELRAEDEYRRQVADNAREDFVYGIGRYGQPDR